MPLHGLNHFTICPVDLEKTKDFYVDVLGLDIGYRPPLNFPGYWLYSAASPTVHLIGPRAGDEGKPARVSGPTGLFDHVAFACSDLKGVRAKLKASGVEFREQVLPRDNNTQIFCFDPDGVGVELNFPPHETEQKAA
jgi:catechol 2,3-dioxygenase-like lactoylglutathione lyase family enzyme